MPTTLRNPYKNVLVDVHRWEKNWGKELEKIWGADQGLRFTIGFVAALTVILPLALLFLYAIVAGPFPAKTNAATPQAVVRDFSGSETRTYLSTDGR